MKKERKKKLASKVQPFHIFMTAHGWRTCQKWHAKFGVFFPSCLHLFIFVVHTVTATQFFLSFIQSHFYLLHLRFECMFFTSFPTAKVMFGTVGAINELREKEQAEKNSAARAGRRQ